MDWLPQKDLTVTWCAIHLEKADQILFVAIFLFLGPQALSHSSSFGLPSASTTVLIVCYSLDKTSPWWLVEICRMPTMPSGNLIENLWNEAAYGTTLISLQFSASVFFFFPSFQENKEEDVWWKYKSCVSLYCHWPGQLFALDRVGGLQIKPL